jgi:two-component system, cell cycle sensor histidine kinase and response regulator CckA
MSQTTRILAIDDEAPLVGLIEKFLSRMGFTVDTALDGTSAWERFEAAAEPYHLVIADLTLPDANGLELASRMMRAQPDLKVLLCSGYPVDLSTMPAEFQSRVNSLQKPFLPNMLTAAVNELLPRQSSPSPSSAA